MDERLEKALEFSQYQKTMQIQKENLKLRLDHMLNVNISNNIFKCKLETISFLNTCINNNYDTIIILDIHENPIKIENLKEVLNLFLKTYYKAYDEYFLNYEKLKKLRTVKKVVEL